MKKKLLIFLLGGKLNKLKSTKLEIKKFDVYNIDVRVHEMISIINTELEKTFMNSLNLKETKSFQNLNDWKKEINKLIKKYERENILIMNEVRITSWNTLKINYIIKKLKIRTIEFTDLDIPGFTEFQDPLKSFYNLFKIKTKKLILVKIYLFIKKNFFFLVKKLFKFYPDFFLVFGQKSVMEFKKYFSGTKTKMLYGNSFDYNHYLSYAKTPQVLNIKKDYALFLESPVPFFLGDLPILGDNEKMLGDPFKWEVSFDKFCNFIEKKFDLKVYIANHPRVKHESKNPKYYRGRTVLTEPLSHTSKHAKILINKSSTGIAYGVIYNIPVLFIHSSDLLDSRPNLLIRQNFLASQLGRTTINIDESLNDKINGDIFKINNEKYNEYKKNFVTSRNDKILNSEIIKEII